MSQINTNVPSLLAQRVLSNQNQALTTSLERLSTGFRINRGADDPAGLIASENLRSEKTAISAAIKNISRAEQVVNTAEGGLQEINNLMLELQSLVGESGNEAGLSNDEKEANQLQIDSILRTIDRISDSTRFNGQNLLNGDMAYKTDLSDADGIDHVDVNLATIPTDGLDVDVTLNTEAEMAAVVMDADGLGDDGAGNDGTVTIEVTGPEGTQEFTFQANETVANIVSEINDASDDTGVTATAIGANDEIKLETSDFGSDATISVTATAEVAGEENILGALNDDGDGMDGAATDSASDTGVDAEVSINGQAAIMDGMTARLVTKDLDVEVTLLEPGEANAMSAGETESFSITGGASFSITPRVSLAGTASIGINSVNSDELGDKQGAGTLSDLMTGGTFNVVDGDVTEAQDIIDKAIAQVSSLRGSLGAFQKNTLSAQQNNLGVALENTSAAESVIRETDFASETANLTRQQILSQAATQALSIANAQPQAVLALLG